MKLTSIDLLITEAEKRKTSLGKYALEMEAADQEVPIELVYKNMASRLTVMKNSVAAGL